jgi:hypothetical protein
MFPNYWHQFVENHQLAGKSACLGEEVDLSTLGADMQFLTEAQSIDELTNFWPGLGVSKDGYVPVASCSIGSGDYSTSIQAMGKMGRCTACTMMLLAQMVTKQKMP